MSDQKPPSLRSKLAPQLESQLTRLGELQLIASATELRDELRAWKQEIEVNKEVQKFLRYQNDPTGFVNKVLREHLWSKQQEIIEALLTHRRVAVKSCHDVGKSFIASRTVAWFLSCNPVGDAFAVTTAPSFAQVRAILWREINKAHGKGNLPGHTNQTEWHIGKEFVGFGRKPGDLDPTAFQGIHALRVIVVIDEACGVPRPLWDAADSLITNEESRILAIGNPDDPTSHFAEVCKPGSGWKVIQISAFDSPNFTGEPVPEKVRPLLISQIWVEEKRKSWGESSPVYIAKVLGEFPDVSDDTIIPIKWVRDSESEERHEAMRPFNLPNELGIDCARFGSAESVIYHRSGCNARFYKALRRRDLMYLVGEIINAIIDTNATAAKIDDTGLGGGVTDRLHEIQREERQLPAHLRRMAIINCKIVGINSSWAATGRKTRKDGKPAHEKYYNLRSEMWFDVKDRFEEGNVSIGDGPDDPNEEMTKSQLCSVKYFLHSKGRLMVESKDDMEDLKKKGIVSPDRADAFVLAFLDASIFDKPAWVAKQKRALPGLTIMRR